MEPRFFGRLTSIREAWRRAKDFRVELGSEVIDVEKATGRYLSDNVVSEIDVPPFDKSAMDGYALRSADTSGASPYNPALLRLVGESRIGRISEAGVEEGEAVRIDTGAPIPPGADAVIEEEYCRVVGDTVEVTKAAYPGYNVVRRGEDVRRGEKILVRGKRITPWDVALAKSAGVERVRVYSRPAVAVMSTGSELVYSREEYVGSKVIDSNRPLLKASLESLGAKVIDLGIVGDDRERIADAICKGAEAADMVVTTGGVSVGREDYTVRAVEDAGRVVFHGIAIRPGMPTSLGVVDCKPVFMLSGNPVAAYVAYKLLVETFLLHSLSSKITYPPILARVAEKVPSAVGYLEFVRIKIEYVGDELIARLVRRRGSSIISSIVNSDGVLPIPEEREGVPAGTHVPIFLHTVPWGSIVEGGTYEKGV